VNGDQLKEGGMPERTAGTQNTQHLATIENLLKGGVVDKPKVLIGAETVQVLLFREAHDFTIFRTEDTRELNEVSTPRSFTERTTVRRVAFLGGKQKAAESRELQSLLRSANTAAAREVADCWLKDKLCGECPRCGLFGAVDVTKGTVKGANLKHRIEYSTAFSLLPIEEIGDALTFNAVDEKTQKTGQALQTRHVVDPTSLFPSVVTLRSVTTREFGLALKALLMTTSYGAEGRTGGDMRNQVAGIVVGWEEAITSLELTLALADAAAAGRQIDRAEVATIAETQKAYCGYPTKVAVLTSEQVEQAVTAVQGIELDKDFLNAAYEGVKDLLASQK
jgi:CRISPR type I-D-associated protein Csc2